MRNLVIFTFLNILVLNLSNGQQVKSSSSIELYDLICLFIPDAGQETGNNDWKTGANHAKIKWITKWITDEPKGYYEMNEPYYREGTAIVSFGGKVVECLGTKAEPCPWNICLAGPRGFYTGFFIESSVNHQELTSQIKTYFPGKKYSLTLLKSEYEEEIYQLKIPGKQIVRLVFTRSCGSAGCSVGFKCLL